MRIETLVLKEINNKMRLTVEIAKGEVCVYALPGYGKDGTIFPKWGIICKPSEATIFDLAMKEMNNRSGIVSIVPMINNSLHEKKDFVSALLDDVLSHTYIGYRQQFDPLDIQRIEPKCIIVK